MLKERGENIPPEDLKKCAREIKEKYGYVVPDGNLITELAKYDKERDSTN